MHHLTWTDVGVGRVLFLLVPLCFLWFRCSTEVTELLQGVSFISSCPKSRSSQDLLLPVPRVSLFLLCF